MRRRPPVRPDNDIGLQPWMQLSGSSWAGHLFESHWLIKVMTQSGAGVHEYGVDNGNGNVCRIIILLWTQSLFCWGTHIVKAELSLDCLGQWSFEYERVLVDWFVRSSSQMGVWCDLEVNGTSQRSWVIIWLLTESSDSLLSNSPQTHRGDSSSL